MFIVYADAVANDTFLHSTQPLKLLKNPKTWGKIRENPGKIREKIREKIRIFQKLSEMV